MLRRTNEAFLGTFDGFVLSVYIVWHRSFVNELPNSSDDGHMATVQRQQIFVRTLLFRYRSRTSSSPIRSIYSITFSIETM